jgi:hypothetical protein
LLHGIHEADHEALDRLSPTGLFSFCGSEATGRLSSRNASFVEAGLEVPPKCGVMFQELVDQIVVLLQRCQLERRHSADCDDNGLLMTKAGVPAEMGFGFT